MRVSNIVKGMYYLDSIDGYTPYGSQCYAGYHQYYEGQHSVLWGCYQTSYQTSFILLGGVQHCEVIKDEHGMLTLIE